MSFGRITGRLAAVLAASISVLLGSPAIAGSFQVSPVRVSVQHDRPIGAITIRNQAAEPVSIRVLTFRWTQKDGEDIYEPTDDLLASPPIFTAQAGRSQLIRVGLRKPAGDGEAAYRIILEEIPQVADVAGGVRVALRLNLPFYKQPKARGSARVQWTVERSADGRTRLRAVNSGSLHDQINRIDGLDASGKRVTLVERPSVVLPGSSKSWSIGDHDHPTLGHPQKVIVVKPGGEEEHATVLLDPS